MSAESRLARLEREYGVANAPPPVVEGAPILIGIYDPASGQPVYGPDDVQPAIMLPDNGRALRPAPDASGCTVEDIPEPSPE